ncbi:hypothetical protein EYF80_048354 [Liparis tanakae]|uniref:Uncharacterized protein n=1 Tax=Liparis tanakae TaxID=230148 RepID=A0A4Z2FJV0_9TELE|nr:hypothetical protein EYF80_048354 [Liparis tanakae]
MLRITPEKDLGVDNYSHYMKRDKRPPARLAMGTTVVTIEDVQALEVKEEREESILAMLGIVGTFLNLFVIVFVYIYTIL